MGGGQVETYPPLDVDEEAALAGGALLDRNTQERHEAAGRPQGGQEAPNIIIYDSFG